MNFFGDLQFPSRSRERDTAKRPGRSSQSVQLSHQDERRNLDRALQCSQCLFNRSGKAGQEAGHGPRRE
jgi:hypothetical protein